MKKALTIVIIFAYGWVVGQEIKSVHSLYDNSFRSWTSIYVEDPFNEDSDTKEGTFEIVWGINNDWSEWRYDLEDDRGRIELRGNQVVPYFELSNQNAEVWTARTVWPRDFKEWKIKGHHNYVVKQKFSYDLEEWLLLGADNTPLCTIFTDSRNDLRDWILDYHTQEILPIEIQQFFIFLVLYNTCPKI